VGLLAFFDANQALEGFNLLAGGGLGMTHNNEETFPRLASLVAYITPEQALETVRAIVGIHRDYGNRSNRKLARLKYVLEAWGVERFRAELAGRLSFPLQEARPMPALYNQDHLGWHAQGDGKLYLGLPINSGRIHNVGDMRLRDGLRQIITQFNLPVRLTAQQNILLIDIAPSDQAAIERLLDEYGITRVEGINNLARHGLACPALPTCGLAITEAERVLPKVLDQITSVLNDLGLGDAPISVRMTGCPNGCARPYMAEIGLVGRSLEKYSLFLGGSLHGVRLNQPYIDLVPFAEIGQALRPALTYYRDDRTEGESFGDFCDRVGLANLPKPQPSK
jgi:sulfite reductase (ferredoxin)